MSVTKEGLLQQTCLSLLSKHLADYFALLADLQCVRAGGYLGAVLRLEPALDSRAAGKVVEELMHPFKLLADCERKYYEWSFLPAINPPDGGAPLAIEAPVSSASLSSSSSFAGARSLLALGRGGGAMSAEDEEGSLKFKYAQIPVALKKTMQVLHKIVVTQAQQQAQLTRLQQQQQQQQSQLPPSASSSNLLAGFTSPLSPLSPRGAAPTGAGNPSSPPPSSPSPSSADARETVFTSLLTLLEEIVSGYIPVKLQLIALYENLQAVSALTAAPPSSTGSSGPHHQTGPLAPRVRDVHYGELVRAIMKLRARCERCFAHPHLVRLRDSLLHPELFLLEHCLALEGDDPSRALLPSFDWKHSIFTLTRIRAEHARWLQRILARDKEVNAQGSATVATGGGSSSLARKGVLPSTNLLHPAKYTPLLPLTSVVSATIPASLHWLHQFSHSLLCKATLLFWHVTSLKSAEVKGASAGVELAQRLERLDQNYVAHFDKLIRKLPNCYSISIVLDCTGATSVTGACPAGTRVVDPLRPLQLRDAAVSDEELEWARAQAEAQADAENSSPTSPRPAAAAARNNIGGGSGGGGGGGGGLGQYPVLFSWPSYRPVLEKWNLVSLLQQKADMMADLAAAAHAQLPPSVINTAPTPAGVSANANNNNSSSGSGAHSASPPGTSASSSPTSAGYSSSSAASTSSSSTSSAASFSVPPSRPFPLGLLSPLNNLTVPSGAGPQQRQLVALGPSNHPADLLVWDFENELPIIPRGGVATTAASPPLIPPGAVSYFLARLDVGKSAWLLLTFQQGCINGPETAITPTAAAGGGSSLSRADGVGSLDATSLLHSASGTGSSLSAALTSSGGVQPPPTPSSASGATGGATAAPAVLPSPADRRRAFERLVAEISPVLQKLRHLHILQHLQPNLGKKKG